jgi:hypothetical protein
MRKLIFSVAAALLLFFPLKAHARKGVAALGKEFEKSLKAKDAGRKVKKSIDAGSHVRQDWTADGRRVNVYIYEFASPEEAARHMELAISSISFSPVKERLPNLGDAAFVSTDKRGAGAWLALRKGGVYVVVDADTLKAARKFAKDIADHLALR